VLRFTCSLRLWLLRAPSPHQDAPFFTVKLGVRVLPAVVLFKDGVSVDRLVGFEQLGGSDDFSTAALEGRLRAAGVTSSSKAAAARRAAGDSDDEDDEADEAAARRRRQQQGGGLRRGFVHKQGGDDGDEDSDFD
jgi:thioredoxin-like negative regulator of GroEL